MSKESESSVVVFTLVVGILAVLTMIVLFGHLANEPFEGPSMYEDSKLIRDGPL